MSINIVFMGTPDFATPCLQSLIDAEYHISGVFCQPDKPKGRGNKVAFPPVKELALSYDIPVFQPTKLKDGTAYETIKSLHPDLIVVVAYGRILPVDILELPPLGCINVHGSLLPKLRGAAPIQWSILNGDDTTGITTMYMAEGLDTGDMILQKETPIGPKETSGELFDRLAPLGAELLLETIPLLVNGTAPCTPQKEENATYAPIITKELGEIDFSRSAEEISHYIRGLNPWPSAYTFYNDQRVIIHQAEVVDGTGAPGEIIHPKELIVACGEKALKILEIQPQGKKRVDGISFANGRRLVGGEKFISPSYSI